MTRRRRARSNDGVTVNEALERLDAPALRELLRMCLEDGDALSVWLRSAIIDRAARSDSGWVPNSPTGRKVSEIKEFAKAARRVGSADPSDVDTYLQEGVNAFLAKDYQATIEIFRALLPPAADAEIYLGQDEMLEEVLGVNLIACAMQFVVSVYMTTTRDARVAAVLDAVSEMSAVGYFRTLIDQLQDTAVEPLPDFDIFLGQLQAELETRTAGERRGSWESNEERWLREIVSRREGTEGLARVARQSKRYEDLSAWCRALVEAGDWEAAFEVYGEAARTVTDREYARGLFLDGVAQCALALGRDDLDEHLERAWRETPDLIRLQRWLGTTSTAKMLRSRAAKALKSCPAEDHRQQSLLHILRGSWTKAATLLQDAPGLGWSRDTHPGHLVFSTFYWILGGEMLEFEDVDEYRDEHRLPGWDDQPLHAPICDELIDLAELTAPESARDRNAILKAMQTAAEKRLEGITANKRRRHYGHAAVLAVACVEVHPESEMQTWLADLRSEYSRFSALQREFRSLRA